MKPKKTPVCIEGPEAFTASSEGAVAAQPGPPASRGNFVRNASKMSEV